MNISARYLIDTSAHARVHHPQVALVLTRIVQDGPVATCGIAVLEALYAARSVDALRALDVLVDNGFEWLSTVDADFRRAREISVRLAQSGHHRAAGIAHLLVAAVAERHDVTILHYEPAYELIAELTGQPTEWVVPEGSLP